MAESSINSQLNSNISTLDGTIIGLNQITIKPKSDQLSDKSTPKSHELPTELKSIQSTSISLKEYIAKGSYGVVMKAEWSSGLDGILKKIVAIKIIRTEDANSVNREISMMHRLQHSNVVELFGYSSIPNGDHYIVMELMDGGSMDRVIHNKNITISVEQLNSWTAQIVNGLSFIHDNGYIHRDLKPSNLLLSANHRLLKIGDLGTVRNEFAASMTKRRIGTMIYMAPEVIIEQKYTSKCDIYSLGITLCEMYTRRRPYEGISNKGLMERIHKDRLRPVMSDELDEGIRSIIKRYNGA